MRKEKKRSIEKENIETAENTENVEVSGTLGASEMPDAPDALDQSGNADQTEPVKSRRKKGKTPRTTGRRKNRRENYIRIEDLEELMSRQDGEIDPETLVSMYMPHRKRRRIGAALLRLDKLQLLLLGLLIVIVVLFVTAFMQEKMGNFTINLNRLELYRKGISIAENGDFEGATAKLVADTVADATNISIDDLPEDIDEVSGSHNGKNYMAYTYYIRNAGKEDLGYNAKITLDSCAKGAEEAVRVAVWRNGDRIVYAAPSANGDPEKDCENFQSDKVVCSYREENFLVGNVDKYTIVIWMEGDDPECVDSIIGGSVEFSMRIDADADDDTSLLWKFVKDIKDTITGDKPINAAGNEAPNDSYYSDGEITWDTRRNQ